MPFLFRPWGDAAWTWFTAVCLFTALVLGVLQTVWTDSVASWEPRRQYVEAAENRDFDPAASTVDGVAVTEGRQYLFWGGKDAGVYVRQGTVLRRVPHIDRNHTLVYVQGGATNADTLATVADGVLGADTMATTARTSLVAWTSGDTALAAQNLDLDSGGTVTGTGSDKTVTVTDVLVAAGGLSGTLEAASGTQTGITEVGRLTTALDLNMHRVTNLPAPVADGDFGTLQYGSQFAQGVRVLPSVQAHTVVALAGSPTYDNGTDGVGATLTAASISLPTINGQTLTTGQRVLVMAETNAAHNGIYTVTQTTSPYVLTRATDMDGSPASEFTSGTVVEVNSGVFVGYRFVLVSGSPAFAVGTDDVEFLVMSHSSDFLAANVAAFATNTTGVTGPGLVFNAETEQISTLSFDGTNVFTFSAPGRYYMTLSGCIRLGGSTSDIDEYTLFVTHAGSKSAVYGHNRRSPEFPSPAFAQQYVNHETFRIIEAEAGDTLTVTAHLSGVASQVYANFSLMAL